ncbi:hypothetical protein VTN00DRAFT_3920 [Thermoascus crustaceus]|uniref:uncharacterized protein n=1 Tax=Thermoascus crustaceus TaxID=5088 RepID=UPI00374448A0
MDVDTSTQNEAPPSAPLTAETEGNNNNSNRRKSGRATRKPEFFSEAAYSPVSTKRKRAATQRDDDDEGEEDANNEEDASQEESGDEDDDDDDADEEELKEKRRAARKAATKKTTTKAKSKPKEAHAAKKPKIAANGVRKQLAIRPATNGKQTTSRPRKPIAKPSLANGEEEGLYVEVFARGHTVDAVAAEWLTQYERDSVSAMRDLVNFVLRCTGTDLKVENQDIEDVDNVTDRIDDLQQMYQQQTITDYPLISKAKKYRSFQSILEAFFVALIQTLHHSSVLYNEPALIENLQVWVGSMSSAPNRPFRHTATIISLSITTALCDLAQGVTSTVSTSRKQLESEKKKKTVNKGRANAISNTIEAGEKKLEMIDELLRDNFDAVFVHRYRDVDPKIRSECMAALGRWIRGYREMFFEGQYIRYLGWVLTTGPKAAGRFFVANVQDSFDAITEEIGEELNETFADEDEDDFESPRRAWIKFKCLVDTLKAYDEQEDELQPERPVSTSREALSGVPVHSRFVLATEAIYPHFEELAHWQSLAGYLLYDHSQISESPAQDDAAGSIRKLYKLDEGQEVILLEVLGCAVKLRILDIAKSDIDKRGRKVKALTDKIPELQEEIAHGLAQIIPQLLNKFGAVPEAASAVLRLEHLVDLDMIQNLQKDATAYSSLLNDINKQFLTHSDQDVLAEASVAFLHARSSDEMKEAMENKIQELWDDMIDALGTLSQEKSVQDGTTISASTLTELTNTVTRISNLASITDCTSTLETVPSSSKKRKTRPEAPFNTLIHLVKRGLRDDESDEDLAKSEAELVTNSIRTLLFYFMWKVQGLTAVINSGNASSFDTAYFEALAKSRETFSTTLTAIMQERSDLDDLRFAATTTFLDLQTLFATLRNPRQNAKNASQMAEDDEIVSQAQALVHEIAPDTQTLITRIHTIAERTFAKRSRRTLEPADDDAPLNSDDEIDGDQSDEEDEADAEDESAANERLRATILAEQRLCELTGKVVLAIIGRVLDASGPQRGKVKQKLLRNKSRLGHNYKEVVAFLEERKPSAKAQAQSNKSKQPETAEPDAEKRSDKVKSSERVEEEDDEHDNDNQHVEEDDEEDLRARELVEDDVDKPDDDDNEELSPAPPDQEDDVMGD